MNRIAPGAELCIREIPLSRLSLAPENVRKTPPDPQADAALKASIAAFGLLENLVVRADEPDEHDGERYAVVAGGRRLKAMRDLVEDGVLDAGNPVPCQVRSGDAEPGEVSLAENVMRIPMHPADQVTAFARLADAGRPVSAIAARFGTSERIVEQRLRLGNAAPELLDAYRANRIDLEALKAFAVTADRERQMAVWEQVSAQGHRPSAAQVKRLLTEERVPGSTAVAKFVGVDAYEAAGGTVMRDLFADEHENGVWFEDPVLLEALAMAKLQAAADELSTRWKWAVPMIEAAWDDTASCGRIEPQPGAPTDEESAEIGKLEARQAELAELDDDQWTEELLAEAESIETRLDEIEGAVEARAMWRREDFAMAGCIVTIGREGALQVIAGLVKPEDMPKPAETDRTGTQAGNGRDPAATAGVNTAGQAVHTAVPAVTRPVAGPRDRKAEARKEAGVGIGLADDLRAIRTALVKAHLAGDFEAAFDLLLFQMGRAVFTPGYRDDALDITVKETPDRPNIRMNDANFADWSPGEAMLADRSHLSLDWLEIRDDGESFAALRALSRAEKEALFAACVARTVNGQLAFESQARPELEATVARLDIDFAAHVRPTADMLWSRITKSRVLDIARAVFGLPWASARSKYKKPALAEAMEAAFAAGDPPIGVSPAMHARALAWVPPGFAAFDTGRTVGDAEDVEDAATEAAATAPGGEQEAAEPAADTGTAPPAANGNGHAPAPEEGTSKGNAPDGDAPGGDTPGGNAAGAEGGNAGEPGPDPAVAGGPDGIAATGPVPPVPANGHDATPDPMAIPEFLRRVQ
ncbi:MAG: ParB N-terminal domain-containing protein [Rhodospirillaceae bacterium]|nr:ParB N-terminal domain-containing protein [Rhodospirillaceae bacterium]